MCNDIAKRQQRKEITVDEEKLEEVEEYKYLGKCCVNILELDQCRNLPESQCRVEEVWPVQYCFKRKKHPKYSACQIIIII